MSDSSFELRRSIRLRSNTPSVAPSIEQLQAPASRRTPSRKAAPTTKRGGTQTSKASTSAAANSRKSKEPSLRPSDPPTNVVSRSSAAQQAQISASAAVNSASDELEEQQVRRSNAYGSPGQAAEPERLQAAATTTSASDLLGAAVAGAIEQSAANAAQFRVGSPPASSSAASSVKETGALRQGSLTRSLAAPSQASAKVSNSGTKRSISPTRSERSVTSANFIATGAAIDSRRGSKSVRSRSSDGANSNNGDAAAPLSAPVNPAAGSRFVSPVSIPSAVAPKGFWSSRFDWFTPVAWFSAFFSLVTQYTSVAGRLLKRAGAASMSFFNALTPLAMASFWLALVALCVVHFASQSNVTFMDRLAAPFSTPGSVIVAHAPNSITFPAGPVPWQHLEQLIPRVQRLESMYGGLKKASSKLPQIQEPVPQVNWFAPHSGVAIDPFLTSPTCPLSLTGSPLFHRSSVSQRLWGAISGSPLPANGPSPSNVFFKWDDAGDCWCSPESNGKAQLGMVLPNKVVPQELVVEHMPESGLVNDAAAATPQDMEMWVQIEDDSVRATVEAAALDAVDHTLGGNPSAAEPSSASDLAGATRALDETWVRVGRFRYQRGGPASQTFRLPVDMARMGAPINRMVVRTLSSWGESQNVCIYRMKLYGLGVDGAGVP